LYSPSPNYLARLVQATLAIGAVSFNRQTRSARLLRSTYSVEVRTCLDIRNTSQLERSLAENGGFDRRVAVVRIDLAVALGDIGARVHGVWPVGCAEVVCCEMSASVSM